MSYAMTRDECRPAYLSFRTKGSNMNYGRNFTFPTLAHLPMCTAATHIQAWHTASSSKLDDVLRQSIVTR